LSFSLTAAAKGYDEISQLQAVVAIGILCWLLSSALIIGSVLHATLTFELAVEKAATSVHQHLFCLMFVVTDAIAALICLIVGSAALSKLDSFPACDFGVNTVCDLPRMMKAGAVSGTTKRYPLAYEKICCIIYLICI
jgi:hypothetical protein